jgi:hypothetical protein
VSYATSDDLRALAALYAVQVPTESAVTTKVLEMASQDVDRHLGVPGGYVVESLHADQVDALRDATAMQAAFRLEQGPLQLGSDDGIASVDGMSFSLRSLPRFSADAAERLAGMGLMRRSGTLPVEDDEEVA